MLATRRYFTLLICTPAEGPASPAGMPTATPDSPARHSINDSDPMTDRCSCIIRVIGRTLKWQGICHTNTGTEAAKQAKVAVQCSPPPFHALTIFGVLLALPRLTLRGTREVGRRLLAAVWWLSLVVVWVATLQSNATRIQLCLRKRDIPGIYPTVKAEKQSIKHKPPHLRVLIVGSIAILLSRGISGLRVIIWALCSRSALAAKSGADTEKQCERNECEDHSANDGACKAMRLSAPEQVLQPSYTT